MPDIQIIQVDPKTGLTTMGMGNSPKILTGINLLAQVVSLSFLRNPGRDVFAPTEGAGIRADIGQFNFTQEDELKLLVMQRTKVVEKEVIGRQTAGIGDPAERLKKLTVLDIATDLQNSRVVARVRLTSEAGDTTDVLV
jgi:hypothetical protein